MKNLEDIFYNETNENLNKLEDKLLNAQDENNHEELINDIFRIVHSIKGSASIYGFDKISDLSHRLESVFSILRNQKTKLVDELIDIVLKATDLMKIFLDKKATEDSIIQFEFIKNKIEKYQNKIGTKEKNTLQKNHIKDKKLYLINFFPDKNLYKNGTNPLFLFDELTEYGETIVLSHEKIPGINNLNPEECFYNWQVFVYSEENDIIFKDVFLFVSEEHQLKIENILLPDKFEFPVFSQNINNAYINGKIFNSKEIESIVESSVKELKNKKLVVEDKINRFKKASVINTLNVKATEIDKLFNIMSEIIIQQTHLNMIADQLDIPKLSVTAKEIDSLSRNLRETVYDISLVPFSAIISRLKRLIFDLTTTTGKKVKFEISDDNIKLDKTLLDNIIDPLVHLLRNCVDHGIEKSSERKLLGKPPEGKISLSLSQDNNNLTIIIKDDGKGIDFEKVQKRALEKNIITTKDNISKDELIQLIFKPGFSTVENVTNISGRGVGMDVVQKNIEKLRGKIRVNTKKNEGTEFKINLPLSLAIQDGLLFTLGTQKFALPAHQIVNFASIKKQDLNKIYKDVYLYKNKEIPTFYLSEKLNIKSEKLDKYYMLLINDKTGENALIVDNIVGFRQFVIKSIGRYYQKLPFYTGASSLGEGEIAFFIDADRLLSFIKNRVEIKTE